MKYPLFFFIALLTVLWINPSSVVAQAHKDYHREWEKIKEAEEKGLTKSAWAQAKKIYKEAQKAKKDQQQIKALIYQLKYRDQIEEQAGVKNIHEVDSLIKKASGIPLALLQNLAANLYLGYVHKNRYTLLQRSRSTSENQEDLTTWSLPHFYDRINSLFQQSLQKGDALKKIQVKDYKVLVDTGKHALQLRPTLYDVLAHNALAYFTSGESTLTTPAQHFTINDPKAFGFSATFYRTEFSTSDSSSLDWQALKIYQNLIGFHLKDADRKALTDVDLDRLKFVYSKAVIPDKDSLYKSALQNILAGKPTSVKSKANYLLAQWYYNKGRTDAKEHPQYRWALQKTLAICEQVTDTLLNEYDVKCKKLRESILRPELSIKTERVNVPDKPFRALVQYKNARRVWFRLVRLDSDPEAVTNPKMSLDKLLQKEVYKYWEQEFPLPDDYRQHSAEIKIDKLGTGRYALIASLNKNFNKKEAPVAVLSFFVSNISYISDDAGDFLVLNRVTGKPIKKAKVRMWKRFYDENSRTYEWKAGEKYKTNREGYFHPEIPEKQNRYFIPEISKKRDYLFTRQFSGIPYIVSSVPDKKQRPEGYLFTDRSIYRPGQRLYFKGLVIQKYPDSNNVEVVKNHADQVFLFDANNQKIDSIKLKTNEYGSFAGSFELPSALMNGRMHLAIDSLQAYQYFLVEAYKRPTYDLEWDSISHEYQLGDTARVSGTVMGYNGSPEGGATVKYQVIRKRYVIPRYWSYRTTTIYPYIPNATISQGEVKVDQSGKFQIQFAALPDEEIPVGSRVFNYEVSVDVTGISGESHHYNYQLPIGDKSLILQLGMAKKIDYKSLDTLSLRSTNLQGKFIKIPVAVSMYALKAPDRFVRDRFWEAPDQFIMGEKEYLRYFPHDEYKGETDPDNWERGRTVYVDNDTTNAEGTLPFYNGILPSGWYLIKAMAMDKHGQFVTDSQYVQVFDPVEKSIPFHDILWTNKDEFKTQPGDKAKWVLGSSENAYVFEKSESLHHTGSLQTLRLNHRIKSESQDVNQKDRGGILKHYVTVKYNRVFTQDIKINVPWKNKQLQIKYKTFRNKLLPGEEETWEVQVKGPQKEKVNAELLASMYDVSLDNFAPHNWEQLSALYPALQTNIRWGGNNNFTSENSNTNYDPIAVSYPDLTQIYPSLKNFGYPFSGGGNRVFPYPGQPVFKQNMAVRGEQSARRENIMFDSAIVRSPEPEINDKTKEEAASQQPPLKTRKDFRETAFFYPQLHTDDSGNVSFSFTAPEALTRWRLMLLANTKDLKYGYSEREAVTQKPLMIQMNAPRFVRQGDTMVLSAIISNLSKESQTGVATLSFDNAVTGNPIHLGYNNQKEFNVNTGENTTVNWRIPVPDDFNGALTYITHARSANFSDGEQDVIPVLTNKASITESQPLHFQGNGSHSLQWTALGKTEHEKETVQPIGITIEYTGNPIWYAVQALPFLEEEKQKSADALYRNIYANALSSYIALKVPHFKEIMQNWLQQDSLALKSPLQKNEELKNVLLEETPWVVNAQDEAAQKARVAKWYSEEDTRLRLQNSIASLRKRQLSNGGFSWFSGMPDDRMITQQIVSGLGHLKILHAWPHLGSSDLRQIVAKAIPYLDARMKEDYDRIQEDKKTKTALSPTQIQYLYARSFFSDMKFADSVKTAYRYFLNKAAKDWVKQNIYLKAQLALTFQRLDSTALAHSILQSVTEHAIRDKDGGIYWKQASTPFYWYQNPIEMQAVCLEAYQALEAEPKRINALRTWLLNQKQTQYWGKGNVTADAVYALLLTGTDWTDSKVKVEIALGDKIYPLGDNGDNGLQYGKRFIPAGDIQSDMKNVKVKISGAAKDQPSWGALYFQYFENMDKVEKATNKYLGIQRQLSLETNTPDGPVLSPVGVDDTLHLGDKVRVRLIVKAERDLDFVHLKDVRASAMEPLQVLSGYHWENGVGYYSSVSDAAVHFYFRHLPKGTFVFTYPVYITQKGRFTGGLSQIACLYAPEIRAHSEGVRVYVR